jgi:protein involved in polysaccharide export with SLBB domain
VAEKGTFPLDRPITIIEAVARAKGFETRMSGGDLVEATDFSRSFLARNGRHVPVDFEALFQRGDLSQNVALEPGDYLFFPSSGSGQVYVLGAVRGPGSASMTADATVLSAIADRGGFTDQAWRQRVLVIRGSLEHPQTFKVDLEAALTGLGPDFALRPGDIIYVSNRPWIRVEELLDHAASAFVESAVVAWTDLHVGPVGTSISTP